MASSDSQSAQSRNEPSSTEKQPNPNHEAPGNVEHESERAVTMTDATTDVKTKARDLTSRILDFLSNASNEALGACFVALGLTTWVILGRIGLILIGVVGGVVLHATWEGDDQNHANDEAGALEARRRREKGLDIAGRVLEWRQRTKSTAQLEDPNIRTQRLLDFSSFQPATAAALKGLTETVIGDYVTWWYGPVLPAEFSFPTSCRQILTGFLLAVSSHLSRKRPADTFLDFLTNASSIIIVFLSELSAALKASGSSVAASDAIHLFLESDSSSSLANMLDVQQQNRKLHSIAEDVLRSFLEPKTYACEPTRVFLREILAGVILEMTVTSCSRSDFINEWIIYSLEEGNTELLDAIDAGVGKATSDEGGKEPGHAQNSELPSKERFGTSTLPGAGPQSSSQHHRTISRAEDAMEEAMQEAKRLSELIAAEEAQKVQSTSEVSSSDSSTKAEATPTSSHDDLSAIVEGSSTTPILENNDGYTDADPKDLDPKPGFTSFDQILSSQQPTALQTASSYTVPPLTLHNASVSIFDDSAPGEKGVVRSKPTAEFLLQVEPATSQYPGWMIARRYSDFETLHEVLRRISVVSGISGFAEKHQTVPLWKNQTKSKLRTDLEHYLRDSLAFQRLAESEGMKRFLEKDQGHWRSSPGTTTGKGGFGFPSPAAFETMGKGMFDVLTSAPKGAAGGGKAILGGVTGVLGGSIGQKRQSTKSLASRNMDLANMTSSGASASVLPPSSDNSSTRSSFAQGRGSQDSPRPSLQMPENFKPPPLPRRPSQASSLRGLKNDTKTSENSEELQQISRSEPPDCGPLLPSQELHLPPPPSEIADDFKFPPNSQLPPPPQDISSSTHIAEGKPSPAPQPTRSPAVPLSSQETSVAIELFFATINELYTLSSAWTLRLTLLNAAKSFLLRPGNPNLEAIRVLLQTTIIEANTTDAGIAAHLLKLRQNALPTADELKAWPPPPSDEDKERKRQKARKLLVEKGMPQALTSVMGAAASGEALGRVFDCLQVPEVARGLVFALILQGVRAVTQ